MKTNQQTLDQAWSINSKYDLKPYLVADAAKTFVIFSIDQNKSISSHQFVSLFSHFLPNLHTILLVGPTFDFRSSLPRNIERQYGKRVQIVQQDSNDLSGGTFLQGITYALDQGAKNIIQLSNIADDEIGYLPDVMRFADQYDLIIGSRFLQNQEFIYPQIQMQFNIDSWVNRTLLSSIFSGKITDANSKIRCWSRMGLSLVIPQLRLRHPRLLNLEMTYLSHKYGLRIMEFPVAYKPSVMSPTNLIP